MICRRLKVQFFNPLKMLHRHLTAAQTMQVVSITGPRQSGKTTLLAQMAFPDLDTPPEQSFLIYGGAENQNRLRGFVRGGINSHCLCE